MTKVFKTRFLLLTLVVLLLLLLPGLTSRPGCAGTHPSTQQVDALLALLISIPAAFPQHNPESVAQRSLPLALDLR